MDITIHDAPEGPVYRRLFETLREAILANALEPGDRLPSTRGLSRQTSVSRNTVNTAYEMLEAEGYVVSRRGSGFFVSRTLPDHAVGREALGEVPRDRPQARKSLSDRGEHLARRSRPVPAAADPAFAPGLPALDRFPHRQWQQHLARRASAPDDRLLCYQDQGGLAELRTALRDYLRLSRGVRCDAEQIIVVSGGQAALDLTARLVVDEGDRVVIEEPGYLGARDALLAAGASLVPVDVDREGIRVDRLPRDDVELVYVTPSYQFPLGVTLSASRRIALLQWAGDSDAYIIEDDYDSEFRYRGRPLSSLQGLDDTGRVIYVGTFSKVMFPSLRLGYIVVPPHLAESFKAALRKTGQDAPLLIQAAMADFIEAGHFTSHIRRMRKLYAERQEMLVDHARRHLSDYLSVEATDAGMQLPARFVRDIDEAVLARIGEAEGLALSLLSRYYIDERPDGSSPPGLFLGYAGIPEHAMAPAILRLRAVLERSSR